MQHEGPRECSCGIRARERDSQGPGSEEENFGPDRLALAAEQGEAGAQNNLGLMYSNGRGVPQDYVSAHMWLNVAAATGDEDARKARENVAASMTREQIAERKRGHGNGRIDSLTPARGRCDRILAGCPSTGKACRGLD